MLGTFEYFPYETFFEDPSSSFNVARKEYLESSRKFFPDERKFCSTCAGLFCSGRRHGAGSIFSHLSKKNFVCATKDAICVTFGKTSKDSKAYDSLMRHQKVIF